MSPRLDLPWTMFGRPVKPLSFAALCAMVVIAVVNLADLGLAGDAAWGDVLAGVAAAGGGILAAGWWARSQTLTEVGLLIATVVWWIRMVFALLTTGWQAYGWAFSACWVVALGGAYLLERSDTLFVRRRGS